MTRGAKMAAAALLLLAALAAAAGAGQSGAEDGRRKVSMRYNPGWNGSDVNLLHVRAVGARDTLHWVWSSIGAPAVLLVATEGAGSSLRVNWSRLLSPTPEGAVWIDPPGSVLYSGAVAFTRLFEARGAGSPEELFYPPYELAEFSWASLSRSLDPLGLRAELRGTPSRDPAGSFANGTLAFKLTAYAGGGRDGALPGLLHTADSAKAELVLAGLAASAPPRLLLEVVTVQPPGVGQRLRLRSSPDDEHSPGLFQTVSLEAEPQSPSCPPGCPPLSFLQWRPAAYGCPRPRPRDALRCQPRGPPVPRRRLPPSRLLQAFFGRAAGSAPGSAPCAAGSAPDTAPCAAGSAPDTAPCAAGSAPCAPGSAPCAAGTAPCAAGTAPCAAGSAPCTAPYAASAFNLSFEGQEGGGGALGPGGYLSWSALVGFGQPPQDSLSPLVLSVAALALGSPLLLLLLLGTCLLPRARARRGSAYQPIN